MTRQNTAFLVVGIAFGVLLGFAGFNVVQMAPGLDETAEGGTPTLDRPAGPQAPTGGPTVGAPAAAPGPGPNSSAAPMMARVRELRARIEQDPKDVEALVGLANLYHDVSMFEEAIGFYESALEVQPGDPNLLTDLGTCFRGQGDSERALEMFAQAQQRDPQHWQSLFNTVIVAGFELRRFEEAEAALAKLEGIAAAPPQVRELRTEFDRLRSGEPSGGAG